MRTIRMGTVPPRMLLLMFALGCGGGTPEADEAQRLPAFVRVIVRNATIGPGKVDGSQWDGVGRVPPAVTTSLAGLLLHANPYTAVAAFLAERAGPALDKPEPRGWGELYAVGPSGTGGDFGRRVELPSEYRDTFTPAWTSAPGWTHVPLADATRIHLHFDDADAMFDDPMGDIELNRGHIVEALRLGTVDQVKVADQTANQILFIGISVLAE